MKIARFQTKNGLNIMRSRGRIAVTTLASMLSLVVSFSLSMSAAAADLSVNDGVVVKFGQDAGMTVRDRLTMGRGVQFTSLKDGTVQGITKPGDANTPPQAGDWRGLKIESTTQPAKLLLSNLSLRYGGGLGGAALDLNNNAFSLRRH